MFSLILTLSLGACRDPGSMSGPLGHAEIRTALFRVGREQGRREMFLFLSTGVYSCGLPDFADPQAQAAALEQLAVATCREGSQHVSLSLYTRDAVWLGDFAGADDAPDRVADGAAGQVVRGRYFGVEEAYLSDLDGLVRGYTAQSVKTVDPLGEGGHVVLESLRDGSLRGAFQFPVEEESAGLYGDFHALPCDPDRVDASLLDTVEAAPLSACNL